MHTQPSTRCRKTCTYIVKLRKRRLVHVSQTARCRPVGSESMEVGAQQSRGFSLIGGAHAVEPDHGEPLRSEVFEPRSRRLERKDLGSMESRCKSDRSVGMALVYRARRPDHANGTGCVGHVDLNRAARHVAVVVYLHFRMYCARPYLCSACSPLSGSTPNQRVSRAADMRSTR